MHANIGVDKPIPTFYVCKAKIIAAISLKIKRENCLNVDFTWIPCCVLTWEIQTSLIDKCLHHHIISVLCPRAITKHPMKC